MKAMPSLPVYSQIAYDIAVKIATGELKEKERFSGRTLLSSQYGVSSETIRRALKLLVDVGIVRVQQGVGVQVLSRNRALEYVELHKSGRDLRKLKNHLRSLLSQRKDLDDQIYDSIEKIVDLTDRFRRSDPMRTYEFVVEAGKPIVGRSIGSLMFRQNTGATIVAIRRRGEVILSPGPMVALDAGDVLVVACDISHVERVSSFISSGRLP